VEITGAGAAPGLDRSCAAVASAGTGKTTALVRRIADSIASGTPVDRMVAVTFTHAAAGNMKLRVRHELEQRRPGSARTLDRAFIGTIHAFCAQLLRRRPVEAGVDPVFQELAQPEALAVFARVFQRWIEARLATPSPTLERAFARLSWVTDSDSGEPLDRLRMAAWALTEWRDFDAPWDKRNFDLEASLNSVLGRCEAVKGLPPVKELLERLQRGREAGRFDANAAEDEVLRLPWKLRFAKAQLWDAVRDPIEKFRRGADADLAAHLREELWPVVDLYQAEKRAAGQLDFMDLLLYARNLLRNDAARRDLQRSYDRIFVDEFQDTDPLQAEILLLLAAQDPAERDWQKATPAPGKLYVVGDPKQSIYRFRRADARLFSRICRDLESRGVAKEELTRSTPSTRTLQTFVNAAFAEAIPDYLPLEGGAPDIGNQPGVVALPIPKPYGSRNLSNVKIEECSPGTVAAFIQWLCTESGWKVRDRSTGELTALQPEHVCILFRRFTNFGTDLTQEYVRALEARGIAHLLVGSKSFHRREEVGTLRSALHAVEWPEDELSVFAVLRDSLFAVLDETLLKFRNQHGRFHPMRPLPEDIDPEFEPIRQAFALLRDLHRRRNYQPIADTIHELLEATRAHAGFAFRKGGRRVLANVYRLTDLARGFEASGQATSFRAFVEYLDAEYESSDASEAPVLEQEGGGVQLMTVHKAKGLEFPVVILADLTAKLTGREGGDRFVDADRGLCAQRLLGCAPWELLDATEDESAADREEAVRVAYVAATRARDLLVVNVIGEEDRQGGWLTPLHAALYPREGEWRTAAAAPGCPKFGSTTVLNRPPDYPDEVSVRPGLHRARTGAHDVVWFDPALLQLNVDKAEGVEHEDVLSGSADQAVAGLQAYEHWKASRAERVERGAAPRFNVAAAETFGEAEEAADIAVETVTLPVEGTRPGGRRFGRVVHDVLQYARSVEDVPALAELWARAHGRPAEEVPLAAEAARGALAWAAAAIPAGAEVFRELPVMVRLRDGTLVDGRIDLAWNDGRMWTVVDYKTDRRAARNLDQVRLYALALKRLTGLSARGIVLEV